MGVNDEAGYQEKIADLFEHIERLETREGARGPDRMPRDLAKRKNGVSSRAMMGNGHMLSVNLDLIYDPRAWTITWRAKQTPEATRLGVYLGPLGFSVTLI